MKRHRMNLPHKCIPASRNDHSANRHGIAPQSVSTSNPLVFSQLYPTQHGLQHQLFSRTSDPSIRYDPRTASLGGSIQRSHMPASIHIPPQASSLQPRRVSLLRDIGIAGERDKDLPTPAASAPFVEGHGGVGAYAAGGSVRHLSVPTTQVITGLHQIYERPITMLGNMHHAYQQQQMQEQPSTPPRISMGSHQLPHNINTASVTEIKKEPMLIKQEAAIKMMPNQPGHLPTIAGHPSQAISGLLQRQTSGSLKPELSGQQSAFIEQKSKEDLVQAMDKVDREITKVEVDINKLQKRKTQLEESAKKPPEPEKAESSPQRAEPKHRDLWQVIYAENRKKAEAARAVLDGICPMYDMPLYNQPSDTKVYEHNLKKNEEMRPKLLKFFQHRRKLENIREKYLGARYDQLMGQWQRKVERIENNVKRKTKEAKTRDFFEKLFPEVRKQREQQERVDRVGTRGDTCRSDVDFAEIVDGLSEQENQLQHMRQLAVVPPTLLDNEERRITFISNNGYIREPFKEFKESQQLDSWADHEKAIFKDKFVQHPKNFNLIASCIEKKSVADCILYYYLTKKTNNYKALVRKQTLKPRKPKSGRAHASHHNEQPGGTNVKESSDKLDKDEVKKEDVDGLDEAKIDKPPSPRMTRARKQTMNWTEEEINLVKEGFGKHGRDFSSISRMVTNKSEQQVKNFYHNYKKKHGLDQLIVDSKKKKTRSRHPAPSPDISATVEDDVASRKTSESPSEEKNKIDKEKSDDSLSVDEKKKSKERTPSPALPTTKQNTTPDTSDSVSQSTSHIRTRRTTAALAAAASQDPQITESTSVKRSSSEKSPGSIGEPAEKKQKKGDRKSRNNKNNESSKDIDKTEEIKDESPLPKPPSENVPETSTESTVQVKTPKTEDVEKSEPVKMEGDDGSDDAKHSEEVLVSKPELVVEKKLLKEKKSTSEDHDSSATCSADEEAPPDASVMLPRSKHADSPYGFDYDFNDSPARISLETPRPPQTSLPLQTSLRPVPAIQSSSSDVVLNLVNKPAVTITSTYVTDGRPQSLPPGSMVPSVPTSTRPTATSNPVVPLIVPGLDNSRPNSTPAFVDFPFITKGAPLHPSLLAHRLPPTTIKTSPVTTNPPMVVESICNLTYNGPASKPVILNVPSVPSQAKLANAIVDLTEDTSVTKPVSSNQVKRKCEAPTVSMPSSRSHQYHPTHPNAHSLQKDFHHQLYIPASAPNIPPVSSTYQRTYTEIDKQAMKDRAADIPEAPIPVSSLRFTSANVKPPTVLQQYKTEPPRTAIMQIFATKPSDINEDIKQRPLGPVILPSQPHAASKVGVLGPRLPMSNAPRLGQSATGIPVQRPPVHMDKPVAYSSAASPSASMLYRPPSPDNLVSGRIVIPGSMVQGKPIFRPQIPRDDPRDVMDKEKLRFIPQSLRGSIVQGNPGVNLANISKALSLETPSPTRRTSLHSEQFGPRPGLLPTLPMSSQMYGLQRLPTSSLTSSSMIDPVKLEKPADSHPMSKPLRIEDVRSAVYASSAQPIPMRLDQHQLSSMGIATTFPSAGTNLHGTPSKGKMIEDVNISPRSLMQRSMTPPQGMPLERKSSRSSQSSLMSNELPSRHSSPAISQEKTFKEEIKRPSSAMRATPERRNIGDTPAMGSHHRSHSTHSLHSLNKPRHPSLNEGRPSDDLHISQASQALSDQRLLDAVAANSAAQMRFMQPLMENQAFLQQYLMARSFPYTPALLQAFRPPLVRPFSPSASESLENSRHVIAQDYATAQQMQHHNMPTLSTARGSIPPSVSVQGQQVLVTAANPLIPPHHAGSPSHLDRLNFIPQHSLAGSLSAHLSPHGSLNPSRNPTASPSSPHQGSKPHHPSPGMLNFPHVGLSHAAAERRSSSSPLRVPSVERQTPTSHTGLVLPPESRRTPPGMYLSASPRQSASSKSSLGIPDGLAGPIDPSIVAASLRNSPHVQARQAESPQSYQAARMKTIKQEKQPDSAEHEAQRPIHAMERQRAHPFTLSPDRNQPAILAKHKEHMMGLIPPGHPAHEALHRQQRFLAQNQSAVVQESKPIKRESSDKQIQEHMTYMPQGHQEKTAKDLKAKGRATLTPAHLINAIIDSKISQFGETQKQDRAKQRSPDLIQEAEHSMNKPNIGETYQIDPKLISIAQKAASVPPEGHPGSGYAPSTRTKPPSEHTSDVISNMYNARKGSPKTSETQIMIEPRSQDEVNALALNQQRRLVMPGMYAVLSPDEVPKLSKSPAPQAAARAKRWPNKQLIHPLTPQVFSDNMALESIICSALLSGQNEIESQSPPAGARPGSNPSRSSPIGRASGASYRPDMSPVPQYRSNLPETKRTENPHFNVGSGPVSAAPMFSALSFRAGQSSNTSQQVPPPTNISGRSSAVAGGVSVPSTRVISSAGTYHPQAQPTPTVERTPLPATEYEPISDSD